jgi:hypothetical protein
VFQGQPSIGSTRQIKAAYAVPPTSQGLEGADADIAKSACPRKAVKNTLKTYKNEFIYY